MDSVVVEIEVAEGSEPLTAAQMERMLEQAKGEILRHGVPANVWEHIKRERLKRLSVVHARRATDGVIER